jgi:hypothetical protein
MLGLMAYLKISESQDGIYPSATFQFPEVHGGMYLGEKMVCIISDPLT